MSWITPLENSSLTYAQKTVCQSFASLPEEQGSQTPKQGSIHGCQQMLCSTIDCSYKKFDANPHSLRCCWKILSYRWLAMHMYVQVERCEAADISSKVAFIKMVIVCIRNTRWMRASTSTLTHQQGRNVNSLHTIIIHSWWHYVNVTQKPETNKLVDEDAIARYATTFKGQKEWNGTCPWPFYPWQYQKVEVTLSFLG